MIEPQNETPQGRLAGLIEAFAGRLEEAARQDPQWARFLQELGQELLRIAALGQAPPAERGWETEGGEARVPAAGAEASGRAERGGEEARFVARAAATSEEAIHPLPPITFAAAPEPAVSRYAEPSHLPSGSIEELKLIEARLRLKAEGCRWQVKRRRLLDSGADFRTEIQPADEEIIRRARAVPDCYLWMCNPDGPIPEKPASYEELAECYDLCGEAAAVLRSVQEEKSAAEEGYLEAALDLAAEAQSLLRTALLAFGEVRDRDQLQFFLWLRVKAQEQQILIRRYMRLDDPADPSQFASLAERLRKLDAELTGRRERQKACRQYFNQLRYHLKQIAERPESNHDHDWQRVGNAVEALLGQGLPPSNVDLRDHLLPVVDEMPESLAEQEAVRRVLVEIDRFLASRPAPAAGRMPPPRTPAVDEVAGLLAGRSLVMIGGEARAAAKQALEEAFRLSELVWVKTREQNPGVDFEPYVSPAEVAAVLLAIRWSRHAFSEVKTLCDKHGKPLVRLPAGYHPNQVAEQILAQCGERLRAG